MDLSIMDISILGLYELDIEVFTLFVFKLYLLINLLAKAMQCTKAPDKINGTDANNFPVWKAIG